MRVGVVARADDRGIGIQTGEFARELAVDSVLVVREPGSERRGFRVHLDRYPGAPVVAYDPHNGCLPEAPVRDWLAGVDVVYMVETPYDFRFFEWARDARCATVLHANPEFWRWDGDLPRPDVWWLPTTWRRDVLPAECRVVPVPVPTAPPLPPPPTAGFVHVIGHRTFADRNGTIQLQKALRHVRRPIHVHVECQDRDLPPIRAHAPAQVTVHAGGVEDRWSLYDNAGVLLLPRRYGGLCLPALEAMARGLAVVMTDADPQRAMWPVLLVPTAHDREVTVPCGRITLADAHPSEFAKVLDRLSDEGEVEALQAKSRQFAVENSWSVLRPMIVAELERARRFQRRPQHHPQAVHD